ncbi:hypothetical protein BLOT_016827, partial [Blomia tropicalis]
TNHQFKVKLEKGSSKGKSHGLPRESVPVWGGKPYLFPPFRVSLRRKQQKSNNKRSIR